MRYERRTDWIAAAIPPHVDGNDRGVLGRALRQTGRRACCEGIVACSVPWA